MKSSICLICGTVMLLLSLRLHAGATTVPASPRGPQQALLPVVVVKAIALRKVPFVVVNPLDRAFDCGVDNDVLRNVRITLRRGGQYIAEKEGRWIDHRHAPRVTVEPGRRLLTHVDIGQRFAKESLKPGTYDVELEFLPMDDDAHWPEKVCGATFIMKLEE